MKYLLTFILSMSILFTGIIGCSSPQASTSPVNNQTILATSGDNSILLTNFLYYFGSMKAEQEMVLQMLGFSEEDILEFWTDDSEGTSLEEIMRLNALDHLTDNFTLYVLAKEAGYTYDPELLQEIEKEINDFIIQLTTPETRGEDAFFNMFMITPQEYKNMQKVELTIEAYINSIYESISVSEEEIAEFYEENKDLVENSLHLHATVRHVLISVDETMTDEEKAEATEKANDILRRVQAGEDITELAILYSEDPGVEVNNGEYNFHRGAGFVQEFEEWAFSAQPGDSAIIETQFGYHVMYSVHVDTIEDLSQELEELVKGHMLRGIVRNIIEESNIEWDIDEDVLNSVTVM